MADLRSCIKAGVALTAAASFAGVATANDIFSPEDIGNALPLVVTGSNCGAGNNDSLGCELGAQGVGEDYWYLWTSPITGDVSFDLCDSTYDTILDVIDANTFVSVTCNDDSCGSDGFRSFAIGSLTSGQAVIIGIDSWDAASCGAFTLAIDEFIPADCSAEGVCPGGALVEAEACGDDTNGGCNMVTPTFDTIARGDTICGTMWADGGTRDTDWRRYNHPGGSLEYSISSQVPAVLLLVEGNFDTCAGVAVTDFVTTGGACGSATLSIADLDCIEWVLWVGADGFEGFPCGGDNAYVVSVDGVGGCAPPCPWDFNGDQNVNFGDLLILLNNFGPCPTL
jgi:hypothetical protein